MSADELRRIADQRPFRPFVVRLRGGEQIEIRRSLRTTVWTDRVFFGVNEDPDSGIAKRMRIVALNDIESVEHA